MSVTREKIQMRKSTARDTATHSLLKVTPEVHDRVKELAGELNRLPIYVASELLEWALDRVEIVET